MFDNVSGTPIRNSLQGFVNKNKQDQGSPIEKRPRQYKLQTENADGVKTTQEVIKMPQKKDSQQLMHIKEEEQADLLPNAHPNTGQNQEIHETIDESNTEPEIAN